MAENTLGTADAVECGIKHVKSAQFLLLFSDVVSTQEEIQKLLPFSSCMAVLKVANPERYGVVETKQKDEIFYLKKITEKSPTPFSNLINAGLYVFPIEISKYVAETGLSLRGERELTDSMQKYIDDGNEIVLVELFHLMDIGTKDEYEQINK